jgi:hypothetical protein
MVYFQDAPAVLWIAIFVSKSGYGFYIAIFIRMPIFRLGAIILVLLEKFKICDFWCKMGVHLVEYGGVE